MKRICILATGGTIVCTDDGSYGRKALVTIPMKELLEGERPIDRIWAIGPAIMMKFCAATTRPFNVRTVVSLNAVMVDGTGMCGGCRVDVGGETKFTCVDGPEFDGHLVDWEVLMSRQRVYHEQEACSLETTAFLFPQDTPRRAEVMDYLTTIDAVREGALNKGAVRRRGTLAHHRPHTVEQILRQRVGDLAHSLSCHE